MCMGAEGGWLGGWHMMAEHPQLTLCTGPQGLPTLSPHTGVPEGL